MVRRLAQTRSLPRSYEKIIKEHEKRRFIERVDNVNSMDRAHYTSHITQSRKNRLPHLLYLTAAPDPQTTLHESLNDCLMVGPPFLSDMCSFIIRFRSFTSDLSTDIEFHRTTGTNEQSIKTGDVVLVYDEEETGRFALNPFRPKSFRPNLESFRPNLESFRPNLKSFRPNLGSFRPNSESFSLK